MIIIGYTDDNKKIVRGVYSWYATQGTPLDIIFEQLDNKSMVPDWLDFVLEAVGQGVKLNRVFAMLNESIADSYGPELRDIVIDRLMLATRLYRNPQLKYKWWRQSWTYLMRNNSKQEGHPMHCSLCLARYSSRH
jgi:hypothetical protein